MKKSKFLTGLIFIVLCVTIFLPSAKSITPPPTPYDNPAIIGNFGDLEAGDSMKYKPLLSPSIQTFLESQVFRDYAFLVGLLLAEGDFAVAGEIADKFQNYMATLTETARLECEVTQVIQPNDTYVGRVSGVTTLNIDLHSIWDLLTLITIVNVTMVFPNETAFIDFVSPYITDKPSNFTILTPPDTFDLGELINNPFGWTPLILTNNWSYWQEVIEVDYLIALLDYYIPIVPYIWNLSKLITINHYQQTKFGLNAHGIEAWVNMSYLIDRIFNVTGLYWTDFFNCSFDESWSEYQNWLAGMSDGLTLTAWFHKDSAVLLEFKFAFDSTQFWDSIEYILTNLRDNCIGSDPILDVIINAIHNFPRIGDIYFGLQILEFTYAGELLITEIPPEDLTWLWITLAITIPVGVGVAAVLVIRRRRQLFTSTID